MENKFSIPKPEVKEKGTEPEAGDRDERIRLLKQAFQEFQSSSEELGRYYSSLEKRVEELKAELEVKNHRLEESLKETRRTRDYLSNVLEHVPDGIVTLDEAGRVASFNRAAEVIFEKGADKVLGNRWEAFLASAQATSPEAQKTAPEVEMDINLPSTEGGVRRLRVTPWPLADERGAEGGRLLVVEDRTQLVRLEEQARRSQRLTAMGEMAATMAHEIRNPMGSMELFVSLLEKDLAHDPEKKKITGHISHAVRTINHVITNTLSFARPHEPVLKRLDVTRPLNSSLEYSATLMEQRRVRLKRELSARYTEIRGDSELLKQVFLNLFSNALQAMPEGGELTVSSKNSIAPRLGNGAFTPWRKTQGRGEQLREGLIEIAISDTGVGIAEEKLPFIFDPFWSDNPRGSGLGLAVVNQIISAHDGLIEVESVVGRGTTFTLVLPLCEE